MKLLAVWTVAVVFASVAAGISDDEEGFLEGATCNDAQDCYINDGRDLALACYYNVNKCKCYSTINTIYHLSWDRTSKKCLSSKYGHCGKGKTSGVEVGCTDGFECIENRCRDPKDRTKKVKDAFEFKVGSCNSCRFSENLMLRCKGWDSQSPSCLCIKEQPADIKRDVWDLRNYDGNHNCSVSQFGPCGTQGGVTIECHGDGMRCVQGICINPAKPLSGLNEMCQETKNCSPNLICSHSYMCIQPKSSGKGETCDSDEECKEGLKCKRSGSPWASSRCSE